MRKTRTPLTGVARTLRGSSTDAERRLWYHLRNRQLHGHKFRRQFVSGNYVVDFACIERGLVIELDGGQHADRAAYDERRSAFLRAQGFRVMRFWNDEVLRETGAVLEAISAALGPSDPSP